MIPGYCYWSRLGFFLIWEGLYSTLTLIKPLQNLVFPRKWRAEFVVVRFLAMRAIPNPVEENPRLKAMA